MILVVMIQSPQPSRQGGHRFRHPRPPRTHTRALSPPMLERKSRMRTSPAAMVAWLAHLVTLVRALGRGRASEVVTKTEATAADRSLEEDADA